VMSPFTDSMAFPPGSSSRTKASVYSM
jgi:hypothetical protein